MFLNKEFLSVYEKLSMINESPEKTNFRQGTVEAGKGVNLADCRMIASDVVDIRGYLEESACLLYNGVLTRVAASVLPFRDGPEGKEVFLKLWRSAVYLLGGGVDLNKDGTDPTRTVAREAIEESNMKLTNIKDSGASYWEYNKKPWVVKHVANPEDRWEGYYTWLFTADYDGAGSNDLPEEEGNFRWYKVSDILARPDTKKLSFIKQAIINLGYDKLSETVLEEDTLTEAKQVGLVSYAIRKSTMSKQHPLMSLENILKSKVIFASKEDTKGSGDYVSLSRDLLSHLKGGTDWSCGLVLDGDRLSDKYKISAINANSLVYFGEKQNGKQLVLRNISKYQARDKEGNLVPNEFIYRAAMTGSGFITNITATMYEILKTIMLSYNAKLAVKASGWANDKYKNKTNAEVKNFYQLTGETPLKSRDAWLAYLQKVKEENPESVPGWFDDVADKLASNVSQPWMKVGTRMIKGVPASKSDYDWICVETCGYNTTNSGLILRIGTEENPGELRTYADEIKTKYNVDVTDPDFFRQLGGKYTDEAEERVRARLVTFIERHYTATTGTAEKRTVSGINIEGCIRAILIHEKHKMAFELPEEELLKKNNLYLYDKGEYLDGKTVELPDGTKIKKDIRVENIKGIAQVALSIRKIAEQLSIPIILYNDLNSNIDIIKQIP